MYMLMETEPGWYFQHIGDDRSQLNSNVIRVFASRFDQKPDCGELQRSPVKFHAHVSLALGRARNVWKKMGRCAFDAPIDVLFRQCTEPGNVTMPVSDQWIVWRVGEARRAVGASSDELVRSELGVVVNPWDVAERLRTGVYPFRYPGFRAPPH